MVYYTPTLSCGLTFVLALAFYVGGEQGGSCALWIMTFHAELWGGL